MLLEWNDRWRCLTDYDRLCKSVNQWKLWTEVWFEVFHYSSDERIIEIITEIKFAIKNLLIHSWEERLTCFDCKVCFGGSKFTSSAEGRRFNWLIYDSMTSLFASGRFSKSRGLSASVSFLPSFFLPSPFPSPSFTHSVHRPVILCSRTAQKRLLRRLNLTWNLRSLFGQDLSSSA